MRAVTILTGRVHASARLLAANLNQHRSLVEPKGDVVALAGVRDAPRVPEAVVKRVFEPKRGRVPDLDRAVLGAGDEDRVRGVEEGGRDGRRVALERLDAHLGVLVPDLDQPARVADGSAAVLWGVGADEGTYLSSPAVTR